MVFMYTSHHFYIANIALLNFLRAGKGILLSFFNLSNSTAQL